MAAETGLRYGIDGYPYLLGLTATAVGFAGAGLAGARSSTTWRRRASWAALALSGVSAVPAALGARYVTTGKLAVRDDILARVSWRGNETVADLGSGVGLLAVGAPRRPAAPVPCVARVIGRALLGHGRPRLLRNARRAGVADRIDVRQEDVRTMSLGDRSVDVVLSALCLHNIPDAPGRRAALAEAVRVLRPGGTVVISDLAHVEDEYAPVLRAAGLRVRCHGRLRRTFPPQRLLTARRPEA